MDLRLLELLNGLPSGSDGVEDTIELIARDASVLFVVLLAALFLAQGRWAARDGRRAVVSAGFSALLALGVGHVLAGMVDRPRPYAAHPGDAHLYIAPSHDPSFPSDHATAAFAIAMAIWLRNRAVGTFALVLAAVLSLSRVAVGTHYPSDVLAGAALGVGAALLLWLPPLRRPLDALADRAARIYDALVAMVSRRGARVAGS